MRKFNAIKNAVNFGKGKKKMRIEVIKPVSEMTLIEPRRNTKWLDKGTIYEVVSEVDNFGYFKVQEPNCIGGRTPFIHKSNKKKVKVI